jgi:hypothetical protein
VDLATDAGQMDPVRWFNSRLAAVFELPVKVVKVVGCECVKVDRRVKDEDVDLVAKFSRET